MLFAVARDGLAQTYHGKELVRAELLADTNAIVPGKPEESLMIVALRHEGEVQMPPGPALPGKEVKVLREWIRRGAVWGGKLRR